MPWTDDNESDLEFDPEQKTFRCSGKALACFRDLRDGMIEGSTEADAMRHALDFLHSVMKEKDKGNPLCLKTPEGILLLHLPFFKSSESK